MTSQTITVQPGDSVTVVAPIPPPPPSPAVAGIAGPARRAQSKGNVQSGGTDRQRESILFRAKQSGTIVGVRVSLRGGPKGYSAGDGGKHQVAFSDEFGNPVGSTGVTVPNQQPGSGWTTYPEILVGAPVTKDRLYRLDIDNIHSDPVGNFCSLNHLYNWDGPPPNGRNQPLYPNGEWDLMVSKGPGLGTLDPHHTAVADLRYADGSHQGNGYVGMIGGITTLPGASVSYGVIGGSRKVRSTWQVTEQTTLSALYVGGIRCQTPADLHVSLWDQSGELDDIICAPIGTSTPGGDTGGTAFVGGKLPKGSLTLAPGAYQVRLSSIGLWSAAPIREGTEYGFDPSVSWPYGKFQTSADGVTFTDPYAGLDLQWYGER